MQKGTALILVGIAIILFTPGFIKIMGLVCLIIGINCMRTAKKDYRGEARKACEKVTPKRKQDTTPPWEE